MITIINYLDSTLQQIIFIIKLVHLQNYVMMHVL